MLKEIRQLISLILNEDKYKEMTGHRYNDDVKKLVDSVSDTREGAFQKRMFLHFTDTPKIGINPQSSFTPGYYFYPHTKEIMDKFVLDASIQHRGQARSARYVYLIHVDPAAKIITGDKIYSTMGERIKRLITDPLLEVLSNKFKEVYGDRVNKASHHALWARSEESIQKNFGLQESFQEIESSIRDIAHRNLGIEKSGLGNEDPKAKKKKAEINIDAYNKEMDDLNEKWRVLDRTLTFLKINDEEKQDPKKFASKIRKLKDSFRLMSVMKNGEISTTGKPKDRSNISIYEELYHVYITTHFYLQQVLGLQSIANGLIDSSKEKTHHDYSANTLGNALGHFFHYHMGKGGSYALKSGEIVKGEYLNSISIDKFVQETGVNLTKNKGEARDRTGLLLKIAMGKEYDGVFDDGIGSRGGDVGMGTSSGGKISHYENTQLYLKPSARKYIEIVTMIDRFEGEMFDEKKPGGKIEKTDKPPGHHSPDVDTTRYATQRDVLDVQDPRVDALKNRLERPTGNKIKSRTYGEMEPEYTARERYAQLVVDPETGEKKNIGLFPNRTRK